jgi:hypothetical protein
MAIAFMDAVPPFKQPDVTPRARPVTVFAERAYGSAGKVRYSLRRRGRIRLAVQQPPPVRAL